MPTINTKLLVQSEVSQFFQELSMLSPDPKQSSLGTISRVVKEVRQELWLNESGL
ncbi:MAG: hypothetical protein F6K42_11970 [Leptolyngbya sp. SIO1D8]|nr:hypothetical protein [Leptolyngbya sp. SIO1D8]